MTDVFKEQLVKKEITAKDSLLRTGIIAGALVLIFLVSLFSGIEIVNALFPFIFLGIIVGAYFLMTLLNIEYEYAYTNGELDIDTIINKARRKSSFSVDVRAIEVMAHIEDSRYDYEFENINKVMDFSSGKVNENTYVARVAYGNETVKLIFDPNDVIRDAMMSVLTRRKLHIKGEN